MSLKIETRGLSEVTRTLMNLDGIFMRARKSALSSVGWYVRGELRNHIEYGGYGWPKLHPLTLRFWKKREAIGGWKGRRRGPHQSALFWLGKFARYRVNREGTFLQVDFGKSRRGEPGRVDPKLAAIVRRHEKGETIRVTRDMRRLWGATRRKRPKKQIPGETFYPLRKTTAYIHIPKRPTIEPVFRKVEPRIPDLFEEKFYAAIQRYRERRART